MAPAGKNNASLQSRVAAASASGLGANANWAQIKAAQEAARQAAARAEQFNEYTRKMRSAVAQQMMAPPAAQDFSQSAAEGDPRFRRSSSRGSLLAGNTGGYNPATGGGRLGGRSLLG